MTVIYVDSVFFLNALMDYLILLATARFSGIPLRRRRYFLAALLGGIYAAGCFFPGGQFLSESPVKAAAGVLLGLIAFGGETHLMRLMILLFAVSCALAGSVLALGVISGGNIPAINGIFYTDISLRVLLIAATAAYLVFAVVFRTGANHHIRGEMMPVHLSIGGKTVSFSALYDTGNSLQEPIHGNPVLVVSRGTLDPLLPKEVRHILTKPPVEQMISLRRMTPWLSPILLPYLGAGRERDLLLGIKTDWLEVNGTHYPDGVVALLPTEMEVPALWGGEKGRDG